MIAHKRRQPPLIRFNPLSGTIYVLTRYTVKSNHVLAHEKFDVTLEAQEAVSQCRQWNRARRRRKT